MCFIFKFCLIILFLLNFIHLFKNPFIWTSHFLQKMLKIGILQASKKLLHTLFYLFVYLFIFFIIVYPGLTGEFNTIYKFVKCINNPPTRNKHHIDFRKGKKMFYISFYR